jgi:hypothetical protein
VGRGVERGARGGSLCGDVLCVPLYTLQVPSPPPLPPSLRDIGSSTLHVEPDFEEAQERGGVEWQLNDVQLLFCLASASTFTRVPASSALAMESSPQREPVPPNMLRRVGSTGTNGFVICVFKYEWLRSSLRYISEKPICIHSLSACTFPVLVMIYLEHYIIHALGL